MNGPLRVLELREGSWLESHRRLSCLTACRALCSQEPRPEILKRAAGPPRSSLSPFTFCSFFLSGCAGSSLLRGLFSSCRERGLLSSCGPWASHLSGFPWGGAQALGCPGFGCCSRWTQQLRLPGSRAQALVVVANGLSCSTACVVFPNQGSSRVSCIGRWILYH